MLCYDRRAINLDGEGGNEVKTKGRKIQVRENIGSKWLGRKVKR